MVFFDVGITSYMANIAFDRHVEFCEEYIKSLQEGMTEMWGNGPPPQCLTFQPVKRMVCMDRQTLQLSHHKDLARGKKPDL